jgi:hypothetical protein
VTEQEEAENIYMIKQVALHIEFFSKCDGSFAGVIYWLDDYSTGAPVARHTKVLISKYHEHSMFKPMTECLVLQKRELAELPMYIKWDTGVTSTRSPCEPVKIEYVLLHPAVKGAPSTMCKNQIKHNPEDCWAVWGDEVKPDGTANFNVLSKNDCNTLIPAYLSLRLNYSMLPQHMVPNPNCVLRGPKRMRNMYCM